MHIYIYMNIFMYTCKCILDTKISFKGFFFFKDANMNFEIYCIIDTQLLILLRSFEVFF